MLKNLIFKATLVFMSETKSLVLVTCPHWGQAEWMVCFILVSAPSPCPELFLLSGVKVSPRPFLPGSFKLPGAQHLDLGQG